jgi:TetR/AcrR family transcriptional regulator, cholesterol catabolism regulator
VFKFERVRNYSSPADSDSLPGLRERNKQAKLARIKRAARRLFERQGVEATTIRQIAAAADIGLGTVFSYAANKEDLLVMIFREEVGHAVDLAFANVPTAGVLEQVLHIFDAIIAHHRESPGLARVFVKETPFIDDRRHQITEFAQALYAGLTALIDRSKERGELKADVPAETLAHNLFAIFFFHLQFWLSGRDPQQQWNRPKLRGSLELQLCGLRNSSPSPSSSRSVKNARKRSA